MAKTKRKYIIATFIVSCLATVLTIVSISTQQWVEGDLQSNLVVLEDAKINYGLFSGTFTPYILGAKKPKDIAIVCAFDENVCAFSTGLYSGLREKELNNILHGNTCQNEKTLEYTFFNIFNITDKNIYRYLDTYDDTTTLNPQTSVKCDKTFVNAGLWLTTIIFLTFAVIMGALTSTLSVINTAGNPISPWFNIWGLYIYNSISIFCLIATLILWGSLYGAFLSYNVGIINTIDGTYSNKDTNMGFSYWINFASLVLHIVNILLLYYRQHLISKEPEINEEKIENQDKDGMIFVY